MKRLSHALVGFSLALLLLVAPEARAQNEGPPIGPVLVDLAGVAIPSSYTEFTVDFTPLNSGSTDLTFAFRADPGWIAMDNVQLLDLSNPSGNLLTNGNFDGGVHTSNGNDFTPAGWRYDNQFGAGFAGYVNNATADPDVNGGTCGGTPSLTNLSPPSEWCDGSVQSYDAIDQNITTVGGDNYELTFWLNVQNQTFSVCTTVNSYCTADDVTAGNSNNPNTPATFRDLSNNGDTTDANGNGVNVVVYAQLPLAPDAAPEPVSMALFGSGLLGLGIWRRYQKSKG